ncbi:MAG: hypothetical protein QM820_09785 [Minicystis sp.]
MMDLEQVARLHAALQSGASWSDLLRRERLTRAQWLAAERAWLDAIGAEVTAGRRELSDRYLRALAGEPAVVAVPADAPVEAKAPRPAERPSFELAAASQPSVPVVPVPAIPAAMARFKEVDVTQMASPAAALGDALPFSPDAPPSLPPAPSSSPPSGDAWVPKSMRGFTDIGGTQAPVAVPAQTPLPFQPPSVVPASAAPPSAASSPAIPAAPSPAIPSAMRAFTDVEGTQAAPVSPPSEPALPFGPLSAPSPASQPASAPAAWMPKAMRAFADVGGTQAAPSAPSGPALPFASEAPASRPAPAPPAAPAPAALVPPAAPAPTAPAPAPAAPAPSPAALPPRPAAPPRAAPTLATPALSLEQFASLCVELELDPGRRHEILQRYRLTEEQHRGLDAFFRARVTTDAATRASWDAAYNAYRTWLLQSRGAR